MLVKTELDSLMRCEGMYGHLGLVRKGEKMGGFWQQHKFKIKRGIQQCGDNNGIF